MLNTFYKKIIFITQGLLLFFGVSIVAFATTSSSEPQFEVQLNYAQTSGLWGTYSDLNNAKESLSQIQPILLREYGTFEEGLAALRFEMRGFEFAPTTALFRTFSVGLGADATVFGVADNPVVPVLHADVLAIGSISVASEGRVDEWGMKTRLGIAGGLGYEKTVDAASTDLIEHFPFINGQLRFIGFDQEVSKSLIPLGKASLQLSLALHETFFHSSITPNASDIENVNPDLFAFRWKERNEIDWKVAVPYVETFSIGIQVIAGQQPIPVEILSRVWDYSHQLDSLPELGTLVGAGLHVQGEVTRNLRLGTYAGVYGGYVGGGLESTLGRWKLSAGSWGIEGRSAYHSLGSRLWAFGLTFVM